MAPPANDLKFPFNQRYLMRAWKLLFVPGHRFEANTSKDATWNRGAYLIGPLGHCGECHTPRNLMQGLDDSRKFAGTKQVGWLAYNLTSDPDHGLGGWSDTQLAQYLSIGHAEGHGPASGPMAEVIGFSLRYLSADDIRAMVAYLRSIPPQPDGPPAAGRGAPADVQKTPLGARIFVEACAGCHLPSGQGRQSPWAALAGSHTTADPDANNLLQVLSQGTQIKTSQGLMFMHAFTSAYTDEEVGSARQLHLRAIRPAGRAMSRQIRCIKCAEALQPRTLEELRDDQRLETIENELPIMFTGTLTTAPSVLVI